MTIPPRTSPTPTARAGQPLSAPEPSARRKGVVGLITRHPLSAFFVLAATLSWVAWLPYILSHNGLGIWDYHYPVILGTPQILGVLPGAYLGPIGAAVSVTALVEGRPGLRRWLGRMWRWRVGVRWYALALFGIPALLILGSLVVSGGRVQAPPIEALVLLVPGLALQMITTGLAEEPGWRDFALPRLQRRFSPLGSSFVLGPLWALWHFPLFLTDWGGYPDASATRIGFFTVFCIAFNIVMSWVFNRTRQSVPLSMLLHVGVNNTSSILLPVMFPALSTETYFLMLAVVFTVAAALVILTTRGRLGVPRPGSPSCREG